MNGGMRKNENIKQLNYVVSKLAIFIVVNKNFKYENAYPSVIGPNVKPVA